MQEKSESERKLQPNGSPSIPRAAEDALGLQEAIQSCQKLLRLKKKTTNNTYSSKTITRFTLAEDNLM